MQAEGFGVGKLSYNIKVAGVVLSRDIFDNKSP